MEERKEGAVDENILARAVLVKIFGSDLNPLQGTDREQLSIMYSKTFAISDKTNLGHVLETACYFWGVQKE